MSGRTVYVVNDPETGDVFCATRREANEHRKHILKSEDFIGSYPIQKLMLDKGLSRKQLAIDCLNHYNGQTWPFEGPPR